MKPHHQPLAAALVALLAYAGAARAAERGCPGMAIEADAGFQARFPDLLEHIQDEFTSRADVDTCARVQLRLEGDTVATLTVTLPDGRRASRSVTRRDDVIPTLQALLLVPSYPAPLATIARLPPPSPPHVARRPARLTAGLRYAQQDAMPAPEGQRSLGVELSLITGARMGDGQLAIGAGALGFLEVHGWLVSVRPWTPLHG